MTWLYVKRFLKALIIVFSKIYPLSLDGTILGLMIMFIGFILFNLVLAYFIERLMKLDRLTLATFMIMATFGNTSFIGLSYIDAFYGQDFIVYGIIYDIFGSFFLLVTLGMIVINWGTGKKNDTKSILRSLVLFPPSLMFF